MNTEIPFLEHGKRLFLFIEKKYNGSQKEFAKALGVGDSTVSRYVTGLLKYSRKDALQRLETIGLNPKWYLSGEGVMEIKKNHSLSSSTLGLTSVKVYETPTYSVQNRLIQGVEELSYYFKELYISEKYLNTDKVFGFYASGNSMVGKGIMDGDLLIVSSEINVRNSGCVVVVNLNGSIMVKYFKDNEFYTMPKFNTYEEKIKKDINSNIILGVVFNVVREEVS